jgi:hypothetical protein
MPPAVDQHDVSSDAVSATLDVEPKVASQKILHHEIVEGKDALERPPGRLFFSALSAGLEIGFSLFLMGVMRTLTQGELSNAVVELLSANMYSFGFVLVILGRSEFFTEQTSLAVLPVLNREASIWALVRLWALVYVGNLIGAAAFAWLAGLTGVRLGMISPDALGTIAKTVVSHSGPTIFLSGLLAGWLMGLLSWVVAGRTGHDQPGRHRLDGDGRDRFGPSASRRVGHGRGLGRRLRLAWSGHGGFRTLSFVDDVGQYHRRLVLRRAPQIRACAARRGIGKLAAVWGRKRDRSGIDQVGCLVSSSDCHGLPMAWRSESYLGRLMGSPADSSPSRLAISF